MNTGSAGLPRFGWITPDQLDEKKKVRSMSKSHPVDRLDLNPADGKISRLDWDPGGWITKKPKKLKKCGRMFFVESTGSKKIHWIGPSGFFSIQRPNQLDSSNALLVISSRVRGSLFYYVQRPLK